MAKWVVTSKRANFEKLGKKFHIDPVIARILRNRELVSEEEISNFLTADVSKMYSPYLLKDMEKAIQKIFEYIDSQEKIRVIADYDVDGVCSGYILKEGLRLLGANADCRVPDRIKDGYGLNEQMIQEAFQEGVGLILTCDNGIAAKDAIAYANSLSMTVIVTDHHEVPFLLQEGGKKEYQLPPAYAVVNPKREDCTYPFANICGALVAYKVMEAMFIKSHRTLPQDFLELAAFATICDVMELIDENRAVVKCGLQAMRQTKNAGLQALFMVCDIPKESLSTYHIGFILGPCFNATGRLDVADRAIELLSEKDFSKAVLIARELKELNEQRKSMTAQGVQMAENYLLEHQLFKEDVLVIYLPDCHESIAGIIAGRIKEKYHKPVLVLTRSKEGVKGSGRSIEAYDMYEKLSECKEYFLKFGGHKMAAGFSLTEENIEPLRKKLNQNSSLTEEDFEEKIVIDVPMPISYITKELVIQLENLEPFGLGNEKPLFAQKGIRVLRESRLGKEKNVGKYRITDGFCEMDMMYFGNLDDFSAFYKEHSQISIAYYPSINVYRNQETIQVVLKAYKEN